MKMRLFLKLMSKIKYMMIHNFNKFIFLNINLSKKMR